MLLRYRHGYAAGIHRGLPDERHKPVDEFPTREWVRAAARPRSVRFELRVS